MDFISEIEKNVGKKARMDLVPKHPADTLETWSNTGKLEALGYHPDTNVADGIRNFYKWYVTYNEVYK
jgi:UDP-glucuronate 4-epimerase